MISPMRALLLSCGFILLAIGARAETKTSDVAAYDAILASVPPGQTTIALGDMIVPVETVRLWRDQLAGTAAPGSASQTGINKWTDGIVYYTFDASVTAAHRTAALDAMDEWATFANVTFTARGAQADYILIKEVIGLGGGIAAVGMAGGAQQFDIGSTSWNRGTLCHELGHTLGLIHEHQRSDRDTFVTINFSNVPGGATNGNFTLVPTSTNNGPYDFLSVMHYPRKQSAVNPAIDTITPKPDYIQFLDIMGQSPDRVLSRGDRDGIAIMYPPATVLTTVVTNTKDSGVGSLRAAIYKALDSATDTPGATQTITFQITASDPNFSGGVFTIRTTGRLPAPGPGTTIDATTQTAFTGNTNASGPEVVLNGALQVSPDDTYGLRLSGANATVRGIVVNGFAQQGIRITGAGAMGNTVAGCFVGTHATGASAVTNTFAGVQIDGGATGNRVGGTTAGAGNVISGNTAQGVFIRGVGTNGNFVEGNFIGVRATGSAVLANGLAGIEVGEGAQNNRIGGTTPGATNVISGNIKQGILVTGSGTTGNTIAGNYIGLNPGGTAAIPNGTTTVRFAGVEISGGATNDTIGPGNVISGNTAQGVFIRTNNNTIAGNWIGLNGTGSGAVGNTWSGIEITSAAQSNLVGGTGAAARNVISGNLIQGIYLNATDTRNNVIAGNYIGTNAAGTAVIGNLASGIELSNNFLAARPRIRSAARLPAREM